MAYTVPTGAQLATKYPPFNCLDTATIDLYIVDAQRMVDETWFEEDYASAIMLYAAHLMAINGLGTSADAKAANAGTSGFQSIRSGQLSLTRFQGSQMNGNDGSLLASTTYGRQFADLLKKNKGGPRSVVSDIQGNSPAATDFHLWNLYPYV